MKVLTIAMVLFLAQGCTTVTYKAGDEEYSMTTWFKSVDGLSVIRTPDLFGLKIDSTNTDDDAITAVAKILDYYSQ